MADHDLKMDRGVVEGHLDRQRGNMGELRNVNDQAGSRVRAFEGRTGDGVGSEQLRRMQQRGQSLGDDAEARIFKAAGRTGENVSGMVERSRKATSNIDVNY